MDVCLSLKYISESHRPGSAIDEYCLGNVSSPVNCVIAAELLSHFDASIRLEMRGGKANNSQVDF